MAAFDWKSLIGPDIDLGVKALGDQLVPDASVQNARTNTQNSQLDRDLARAKFGNAQQIRSQMLPGMYTNSGYSPEQGRAMGANYNTASPPPTGGSYGGAPSGPGIGSTIGKTALGVGASMAPTILGGIGKSAAYEAALKSAGFTADAVAPHAAGGVAGALGFGGGSGLLGLGAATVPVVGGIVAGIGLLAKHFFGNGGDRMAANELTGSGGVHDFFKQASDHIDALPNGPEKQAAVNARDRATEQALVNFSKQDKDHYYQAKQTLQKFAQFSTVRPLLG